MNRIFGKLVQPVLAIPRTAKRLLVLLVDTSFCVLSVWLAFYLRLGEFTPFASPQVKALVVAIVLAIPIFIVLGLYRAIFRYSGTPAMVSLAQAIGIYGLLYASVFTAVGVEGVPSCGPIYGGPCEPRTGTHDDGPHPHLHRLHDRLFDWFYAPRTPIFP
jgi:NADH:ubiquinone oxidoreductase subunit K